MKSLNRLHDQQGPINVFPPLVWKYNYNFNWKLLKPRVDDLFSLVDKNSNLEKGEAWSTVAVHPDLQPHTWLDLRDFQIWLGGKIDEIRVQNKFVANHSSVSQSWINKHAPDGTTVEHSHSYTTFVVSSYLQCPDNSGNIEFKDPLEYHKDSWPIIPEETLYYEVPVTTNDVLIFPGWLKHRVQPNLSTQDRYVMTLNIK
jgi:hypothetical protein